MHLLRAVHGHEGSSQLLSWSSVIALEEVTYITMHLYAHVSRAAFVWILSNKLARTNFPFR